MANTLNSTHIAGSLTAESITLPASTVTNTSVLAGAGISATKLEHQFPIVYQQQPGTNVAAATQDVHVVYGATGDVVAIHAALNGVIPSGDRTAVIDVHKSTGGGAFATILSSTVTLDSANTIRVVEAGTLAAGAACVVGDILRVIITVAGSSGTNPQGLVVRLVMREDAQ
jgi:hypothetical protein